MLPDLGPFLGLRRHVGIAHHVPGRIRMKLSGLALADLVRLDIRPFTGLLDRICGITALRVNPAALSVVIEYDVRVIAMSDWGRLLTGERAEVEEILSLHLRGENAAVEQGDDGHVL